MKFKKKSSTAVCHASLSDPALIAANQNAFDSVRFGVRHSNRIFQSTILGFARVLQVATIGTVLCATAHAQSTQPDTPRYPTASDDTTTVRRSPMASEVFVDTAPDTYTVVKGDTLWGIAGRFLKQPWRWPQIWQMNRDQIRNPHWIYPGQMIVLDKLTGTMRLGTGPNANGTVKLSPQIRSEPGRDAIPSIAPEAIEPYLSQPLIVDTATMHDAPRVVASKERVVLGVGDIAYVSGITDPSVTIYQVFRPGRELKDPDTGNVIAFQSDYLGTARVTRPGNPATVTITSSKLEINAGDRLVPAAKPGVINYAPHAPAKPISGRVISVYSGVQYAGASMIVAINRGTDDGLDVGSVLAIKTFGRTIVDKTNGDRESIKLPDERKGLLFIFRVFNHIAYGLISTAAEAVEIGDTVTQP